MIGVLWRVDCSKGRVVIGGFVEAIEVVRLRVVGSTDSGVVVEGMSVSKILDLFLR